MYNLGEALILFINNIQDGVRVIFVLFRMQSKIKLGYSGYSMHIAGVICFVVVA